MMAMATNWRLTAVVEPGTLTSQQALRQKLGDCCMRIAKRLLSAVQQFVATSQFKLDAEYRSTREGCGYHQTIKD